MRCSVAGSILVRVISLKAQKWTTMDLRKHKGSLVSKTMTETQVHTEEGRVLPGRCPAEMEAYRTRKSALLVLKGKDGWWISTWPVPSTRSLRSRWQLFRTCRTPMTIRHLSRPSERPHATPSTARFCLVRPTRKLWLACLHLVRLNPQTEKVCRLQLSFPPKSRHSMMLSGPIFSRFLSSPCSEGLS